MMRPQFDHEEEYLIAYYRQYQRSGGRRSIIREVTTVAVGAVFFGLGYFKGDATWSIIGFGLVAYLALNGLGSGARYNRILASIIEKYEGALQIEDKMTNAESGPRE